MYEEVGKQLKESYAGKVDERDSMALEPWKADLRQRFLDLIRSEDKSTLLEVGAGTGLHGAFFQSEGIQVTSTDMSPEMVEACRSKGLDARQMDFLSLDFEPASFDAVFALNCLLHVPKADLHEVLNAISRVLRPGGLFYWGQYGGSGFEGILENDNYRPKRFFSMLKDEAIQAAGEVHFDKLSFETVDLSRDWEHFQSGTWRKR